MKQFNIINYGRVKGAMVKNLRAQSVPNLVKKSVMFARTVFVCLYKTTKVCLTSGRGDSIELHCAFLLRITNFIRHFRAHSACTLTHSYCA